MKKTIYLAAITLITIGCVLYGVNGWFNGGISFAIGIGEEKQEIQESATLDEFNSITIDAAVMKLTLKEGSSYALEYNGTKNLVMSYQVENGELIIEQKQKKAGLLGVNNASLVLTVPEGVNFENVKIGIDVGDVDFAGLDMESFDADIDVGDLTIEDASFKDIAIDTDTGDVDLAYISFNNLEITSDVGDVEVQGSSNLMDYSFDLKTDVGNIEVNENEYDKKYASNGEQGKVFIRGDVGDITVKY